MARWDVIIKARMPHDVTCVMKLTPRMFAKCVGRRPKDHTEMRKFAELFKEYEWEDLVCGDWSEHFEEE